MGLEPTLFGRNLWAVIHQVALGAPAVMDASTSAAYMTFYNIIPQIIPCRSCGDHLSQTYAELPIDKSLAGSATLFTWTVDIHNAVNKRLGKPIVTVEKAKAIWMGSESATPDTAASKQAGKIPIIPIATLVGTVCIIAIAYVLYKNVFKKQLKYGRK